ncbi:MAG TPA: hypothetical protein DCM49_06250 [Lachnospiraceae bacterium]|nr:hypothetical protein [Lachnospiraceae bacterium]
MNPKTQKLTTGAMFIAVFMMILLLNRQTGALFEEIIFFLLPVPMVAFSAKYGLKSGVPVWAAMSLLSLLLGTVMTVFYAVTEAGIGLVLGSCIYHKVDVRKTLFAVMGLSAVVNVLNTIVLASFFGYDLKTQITEMQELMSSVFEKGNVQVPETMLSSANLMQMMVVSMIVMGLIQGFLVYKISLLILRRMRFQIPEPRSVYSFYPWKWTSLAAAFAYFGYIYVLAKPLEDQLYQAIVTILGVFSTIYLFCFGILFIMLICRKYVTSKKAAGVLICIAAYLMFSQAVMMLGVIYILTDIHAAMMLLPDKGEDGAKENGKRPENRHDGRER